ncbi:MAG: heavy metal sensor histidine kinase [Gemmatimonadota bacterium]|nr:heavy metal sensor histidine kinase [Gemmatimonadota bacterium]
MSLTNPPDEVAARQSPVWSIAGRMSWLHALKTLLIVAAVGGLLYMGLVRELRRQDAKLVASKLNVLEHLVETYPLHSEAIESEVEHEAGDEGPLRYYIRILNADARVLQETPGIPAALPVAAFAGHEGGGVAATECAECAVSADGQYLMATRRVKSAGLTEPVQLQVALDVERTADVLHRYAWTLVIVLGLGVLLSAWASLVVSRMAVRPVQDIASRIRAITASHLDDGPNLASRPWPLELQGLASDFDQMLARLGDSFTRLSQFAADLAHALRNPINNLRGSAEVTLSRVRTAEEYQQTLGSSLEELERLSRLIDGLLFIARSEDPRQAIERSIFPLQRELAAVQDFYEALAAERGVRVVVEGDAMVTGDPMLVRRALSNLLANALRHTPSGGTVTMRAETGPGGGTLVTVSDSGSGIAEHHLGRVFERFYRAEENPEAPGAGLGLAIVRSVMRLHGGEAHVVSSPGVGTTFTLEFPAVG